MNDPMNSFDPTPNPEHCAYFGHAATILLTLRLQGAEARLAMSAEC